ncbi:N-acetyltransferase family protein [Streptosporangium sp. NPDC051022]|uniref:GNAT family N-acetyltransferase n=1 Tax=Streptosporangium sp. NPDC051022 TaxID=3155752 RepID=UPI00343747A2
MHSAIVQATKPTAGPGLEIRPMRHSDADQVLAIYQAGLDDGQAGFETTAPSWEGFAAGKLAHPRYVAVDTATGQVVGRVAASPVSVRSVYAGVVEHSVYAHPGRQARGIGRALLEAFIAADEDAGIWTIQAGIFPGNAASLALHDKLGFRVSAPANVSVVTAASGGMWSCWSGAALSLDDRSAPARMSPLPVADDVPGAAFTRSRRRDEPS